ncbi:MAG: AAA family ATPase [Thermodesulfobacteriota bacterium]
MSWIEALGLARNPFRDTLETDLFFRTEQHEAALVRLRIGIEDRHALILLSGPSGSGKTLLAQVALREADRARMAPALVFVHPGMGKGELLAALLRELGRKTGGRTVAERLAAVQEAALAFHHQGRQLVIVIDEAHFLASDALHVLRTLANLETETTKLTTVLLIAETPILKRLAHPSYAAIRGRITFAVQLGPLSAADTEQYIKYRLLKCKAPLSLVNGQAFATAHQLAGGLPRQINRLLYNACVEALSAGSRAITPEILSRAAGAMGHGPA